MLPLPTRAELAHSISVARMIGEHIAAAGGWLSFETFMQLALYAPGLGYYSAGSAKIGRDGDFTTAPELSDLFSQCVARQCAQVLGRIGGSVLELGAGTGRMAASVLETLASVGALPDQYAILEVSADLRDRQRARIEQLPAELKRRVAWLDSLPAERMRGVILANEVLDALPCQRVVVRSGDVRSLGVRLAGHPPTDADQQAPAFTARSAASPRGPGAEPFVASERSADEALQREWQRLKGGLPAALPDGYRTEVCMQVQPWIASLADCLDRGVVLLFDYGLPRAHYYHPQRSNGTLRCHFRHRAHDDPFVNVGIQDITAWVDFTRVAEAADAAGLQVRGFATQAAFLLGLGIEALVAGGEAGARGPDADIRAQARRASEARQLLMPGEMGEVFKAIALARDFDEPLRGFSLQDLRHLL